MIDLKQLAPKALRNRKFWTDFIEVYQEELENVKTHLIEDGLLNFYDFRTKTNANQLLSIAKSFGYNADVSIDPSIEYLQKEIESIAFRKKFKTTYKGYEFSYKNIAWDGEVFLLYTENSANKLIRSISSLMIASLDEMEVFGYPLKLEAIDSIDSIIVEELYYDQNPPIYYEELNMIYDMSSSQIATRHVALEYFLDRIVEEEGKEYLITNDYLRFLFDKANYNRRAVEVPHVGAQISLVMDKTGLADSAIPESGYSIPDMKLSCAIKEGEFPYDTYKTDLYKIKLGTGSQTLPLSTDNPAPEFPTDLANPLYEELLYNKELEKTDQWIIVQTMIGLRYEQELITDVPTVNLSPFVISRSPVRKKSFKLFYTIGGIEWEANDDGNGNLIGEKFSGTVDYITRTVSGTFEEETDVGTSIEIGYTYNSLSGENEPSFVYSEITEIGLFDTTDKMVAYGTFPPIQYNDTRYHLGVQFFVRRRSFGVERFLILEIAEESTISANMTMHRSFIPFEVLGESWIESSIGANRGVSLETLFDSSDIIQETVFINRGLSGDIIAEESGIEVALGKLINMAIDSSDSVSSVDIALSVEPMSETLIIDESYFIDFF